MLKPRILRTNRSLFSQDACIFCRVRFFTSTAQLNRAWVWKSAPSTRGHSRAKVETPEENTGRKAETEVLTWKDAIIDLKHHLATESILDQARKRGLFAKTSVEVLHVTATADGGFAVNVRKGSEDRFWIEKDAVLSNLVLRAWVLRKSSVVKDNEYSRLILRASVDFDQCDAICLLLSEAIQERRNILSPQVAKLRRSLEPHLLKNEPKAHLVQARIYSGGNVSVGNPVSARSSYTKAINAFRIRRDERIARGKPPDEPMDDPAVLAALKLDFFDLVLAAALYERGQLLLTRFRDKPGALADFKAAAELDEPQAHLMAAVFPEHCQRWGKQWLEHVTKAAASGSKYACSFLKEYYQVEADELPREPGKTYEGISKEEEKQRKMLVKEWAEIEHLHL